MGQYFKPVNLDKKEYVCPWCIGGGAKLWEWSANPHGSILTLLLRKSDGSGGGDFFGYHKGYGEGSPSLPHDIVGRWAGDRVIFLGDYDSSHLWDELLTYRNISHELVEVWNSYIDSDRMKLEWNPGCSCSVREPETVAAWTHEDQYFNKH